MFWLPLDADFPGPAGHGVPPDPRDRLIEDILPGDCDGEPVVPERDPEPEVQEGESRQAFRAKEPLRTATDPGPAEPAQGSSEFHGAGPRWGIDQVGAAMPEDPAAPRYEPNLSDLQSPFGLEPH